MPFWFGVVAKVGLASDVLILMAPSSPDSFEARDVVDSAFGFVVVRRFT